ncbi:hypothetical protein [Deinococcus sp.]|uniref:hypothetical protein n=1 Tax=Deinococcus sp. TaxID=47478 RepID=UPI003C7A74AA
MNERLLAHTIQERQQALLHEAEQHRLLRGITAYRPSQLAAWLRRWADVLEAGRPQPAQPCAAECGCVS